MNIINFIKQFIPPIFLIKQKYFLSPKSNNVIPAYKHHNKVFIFLAANYGNLGDVAITYAQHKILAYKYPNYEIIEVPANCTLSYLKAINASVEKDDILTIVGGGNMGDMYPLYENIRQLIISLFPHNEIYQFPTSVDFSDSLRGILMMKSAKSIYKKHRHLKILAREEKSGIILSKMLGKRITVVPDIVMTLDFFKNTNIRKNVIVCFRKDKEKVITSNEYNCINDILSKHFQFIDVVDTLIADSSLNINNKEKFLFDIINKFSNSKLIVTDRLHGMILGYITGTPVIAFSNSNKKILYSYKWLADCGYVFFMENLDNMKFDYLVSSCQSIIPDKIKFMRKQKEFINLILNEL